MNPNALERDKWYRLGFSIGVVDKKRREMVVADNHFDVIFIVTTVAEFGKVVPGLTSLMRRLGLQNQLNFEEINKELQRRQPDQEHVFAVLMSTKQVVGASNAALLAFRDWVNLGGVRSASLLFEPRLHLALTLAIPSIEQQKHGEHLLN